MASDLTDKEYETIRRDERTGRPMGDVSFLGMLENLTGRCFQRQNPSPKKEELGMVSPEYAKIINCRGAITPDMALRLSRAFDTTPELWINLQKNYDLWHAAHTSNSWKAVKPIFRATIPNHA